eukprot:CAMPEP_0195521058 /NCGR_PEP_ID=MMETSP0794_2-20130614/17860_1 /TAXON_ID=515487 /ORGANISM="Stephanopyxis turris, Strain CCMP 815" /LENGTH=200 /DNA_ID=CAMNT_0040650519 /DNA_START=422 /DNA_END=1024 /DNA_ORIENTATION=-
MHVWFLHRRLLLSLDDSTDDNLSVEERNRALLLQEELFDTLWHDTKSRIRAEGIAELMLNKHLKDVQNYTFRECMSFDHAMEATDAKTRKDDVGLAVWTYVYGSNEDVRDETVDRMAEYVLTQYENVVTKLPIAYWKEGRIGWVPPPAGEFGSGQEKKKDGALGINEGLPSGWFLALTDSGETYYWNEVTMESSWDKPLA